MITLIHPYNNEYIVVTLFIMVTMVSLKESNNFPTQVSIYKTRISPDRQINPHSGEKKSKPGQFTFKRCASVTIVSAKHCWAKGASFVNKGKICN